MLVVMRFISSLVFIYVGIMNEISWKLTQKVYSPSQIQEASHLEPTKLSFIFLIHNIRYQSISICISTRKKKKKNQTHSYEHRNLHPAGNIINTQKKEKSPCFHFPLSHLHQVNNPKILKRTPIIESYQAPDLAHFISLPLQT